uniref:Por_Secre_tail domain-containing protein n=1 Tax=Parastrongyloides trichosuri TaxID=131310 RepID=A0A0N4ZVJ7_PARTI
MKNFHRWKVASVLCTFALLQYSIAAEYPSDIKLYTDGIEGVQEQIDNTEPALYVTYPKDQSCASKFVLYKLKTTDQFTPNKYYEFREIRRHTSDFVALYAYMLNTTTSKYDIKFFIYFPNSMLESKRTVIPRLRFKTNPKEYAFTGSFHITFVNPSTVSLPRNFFTQETVVQEVYADAWDISKQVNPLTLGYELRVYYINVGQRPNVKGLGDKIALFKEVKNGEQLKLAVKPLGPNERGQCSGVTDHEILYYTLVKESEKYKVYINYCAPWNEISAGKYVIKKAYFFINPSDTLLYKSPGTYIMGAPKDFNIDLFPGVVTIKVSLWDYVGVQLQMVYTSIYDKIKAVAKNNMPTIYFRCPTTNRYCITVQTVEGDGNFNVEEFYNKEVIFAQLVGTNSGKYKIVLHYYGPYSQIASGKIKATSAYVVIPPTNALLDSNVEMDYIKAPTQLRTSLKPQAYPISPGDDLPGVTVYENKDIQFDMIIQPNPVTMQFTPTSINEKGLYSVLYEPGTAPPTKIIDDSITVYVTKLKNKTMKHRFVLLKEGEKPTIPNNDSEIIIYTQFSSVYGTNNKSEIKFYVYVPWKKIMNENYELPELRIISPDNEKFPLYSTNIKYLEKPPLEFSNSNFLIPYNPDTNSYEANYSAQFPLSIKYFKKGSRPPSNIETDEITIYKPYNGATTSVIYLRDNETAKPEFYAGKEVIFYKVKKGDDGKYKLSFEIYAPWSKVITKEYDLTPLYIVLPKDGEIKFDRNVEYKFINSPDNFKPLTNYVSVLLPSGEWPQATTTTTTTTTPKPVAKSSVIYKSDGIKPGVVVVTNPDEKVPYCSNLKNHLTIYVQPVAKDIEYKIKSYEQDGFPNVNTTDKDNVILFVKPIKIDGTKDEYQFKIYSYVPEQYTKINSGLPKFYVVPDNYKKQIVGPESLIHLQETPQKYIYVYNPHTAKYDYHYDPNTTLDIVYHTDENNFPPIKTPNNKPTLYYPYKSQLQSVIFKQIQSKEEINTKPYIGEIIYFYQPTKTPEGKILYNFYLYAPWSNVIGDKLHLKNPYLALPNTNYDPNSTIEYIECPESVPAFKRPVILVGVPNAREWPRVPLNPGLPKRKINTTPPKPGVILHPLYPTNPVPTKTSNASDITFYVRKNSLMVCEYEVEEFKGTGAPSYDGLHRKIYIFVKYVKLPTTSDEYEVKLYVFVPWQHITKEGLELPLINIIGPERNNTFIRTDNIFYLNPLQNIENQRNFINIYNPVTKTYTMDYNVDTNNYIEFTTQQPRPVPIERKPTIWKIIPKQGASKFSTVYLPHGESPNPNAYPDREVVFYSTPKNPEGQYQYNIHYKVPFKQVLANKFDCTNVYFVVPRTGKFARKININYIDRPKDFDPTKCVVITCPTNKIEWQYPTTTSKPTTTTTTTTTIPPITEVIPNSYPGKGIEVVPYDPIKGKPEISKDKTVAYFPVGKTETIPYKFTPYKEEGLPSFDTNDSNIQIFVKYQQVPEDSDYNKMIFFVYVPWNILSTENKKLPQFYVKPPSSKILFGPDSIVYLNSPNPNPPAFIYPYDRNTKQFIEQYSPEVNIMYTYIPYKVQPPAQSLYGRPAIYKEGKPIIFIYRQHKNGNLPDISNFYNTEVYFYNYEMDVTGKYQLSLDIYAPWHKILNDNYKPGVTYTYIPPSHKYFGPICQVNWINRPNGFPDHMNPIVITNNGNTTYPPYQYPQPNVKMDLVVFEYGMPVNHISNNPTIFLPNPQVSSGKKVYSELTQIKRSSDINVEDRNKVHIFYRYVKRNITNKKYAIELNVYCPWNALIEDKIDVSAMYVKIPDSLYIEPYVIKKFVHMPSDIAPEKKPIIIVIGPDGKLPNFDTLAQNVGLNIIRFNKGQEPKEGIKSFHPTAFVQNEDDKVLPTQFTKLSPNQVPSIPTNDSAATIYYRAEKGKDNKYYMKAYYYAPWDKISKRQAYLPAIYMYIPQPHLFLMPKTQIEYIGDKEMIENCFGGKNSTDKDKTVLIPSYDHKREKYPEFMYPGLILNKGYIKNDISIPNIGIDNKPTIYRKYFANGTKPILSLIKLKKGENPDLSKLYKQDVVFYRYEKPNQYKEKYDLNLFVSADWEGILAQSGSNQQKYFQTMFLYIDPNDELINKPAKVQFINLPNEMKYHTSDMFIENNPNFVINNESPYAENIRSAEIVRLQSNDNIPKEAKKNRPTIYIRPRGYYDKKLDVIKLKDNETELPSELSDKPTLMYKFNKTSDGKNQLIIYYYAPWGKVMKRDIIVPDVYTYIPQPSKYYNDPTIIKYVGDFSMLPNEKEPEGFISTYDHDKKKYTSIEYPGLKLVLRYVQPNAEIPLEAYQKHPTLYKKLNDDGGKSKITLIQYKGNTTIDKKREEYETIVYYTFVKHPFQSQKYTLKLSVDGPWKLYQDKQLENHNIYLFIDIQDPLVKKPAIVEYLNQLPDTHAALKQSVIEDYSNERYPEGGKIDALLNCGITKINDTVPTEGYRGLPSIYERSRGNNYKFVPLKDGKEPTIVDEPTVFTRFDKVENKEKKYDFVIFVNAPWDKVADRSLSLSDLYSIVPRDHKFVNKHPIIKYIGSFDKLPKGEAPKDYVSYYNHDQYDYTDIKYPGLKVDLSYIEHDENVPTSYLNRYPTIYKKKYPNGTKHNVELVKLEKKDSPNFEAYQPDKAIFYKYAREKPTSPKYNLELTFLDEFYDILAFKKYLQSTFIYIKNNDSLINKPAKLIFPGVYGQKYKQLEKAFYENIDNKRYPDTHNPFEDTGYKLLSNLYDPMEEVPKLAKMNQPTIYIRKRTPNDRVPLILNWDNEGEPNGLGNGEQPVIYYKFSKMPGQNNKVPKYKLKFYYYAPWYKVERRQIILPQSYVYIPSDHPSVNSVPEITNIGDFSQLEGKKAPERCISYYDHPKSQYTQASYPGLFLDLSYLKGGNQHPHLNSKYIPIFYKKSYLNGTYPEVDIKKLELDEEPTTIKTTDKEIVYYKYLTLNDTDSKFTLKLYILAPYQRLIDGTGYFQTSYVMINPSDPIIYRVAEPTFINCPFPEELIAPGVVSSGVRGLVGRTPVNHLDDSLHSVDIGTLRTSDDIPEKQNNKELPSITIYERPRSSINLKYNYMSHPADSRTNPKITNLKNQPHIWYTFKRTMDTSKKVNDIKDYFNHKVKFYVYNNWTAVGRRDILIPDIYIYIPSDGIKYNVDTEYLGSYQRMETRKAPIGLLSYYNSTNKQYPEIKYPVLTISLAFIPPGQQPPKAYVNNRPTLYKRKLNNGMNPEIELVQLKDNESPNTNRFTNKEIVFYTHKKVPKTTEVKYTLYLYIYAPFDDIIKGKKYLQTSYLYIDDIDDLVKKPAIIKYIGCPKCEELSQCLIQQYDNIGYPKECKNPYAEPKDTVKNVILNPSNSIPMYAKDGKPTIYVRPHDENDAKVNLVPINNNSMVASEPTIFYGFVNKDYNGVSVSVFTMYYIVDWNKVKNFQITLPEVYAINGNGNYPLPPQKIFPGADRFNDEDIYGLISCFDDKKKTYPQITYPFLRMSSKLLGNKNEVPKDEINGLPSIYFKETSDHIDYKYKLVYLKHDKKPNTAGYGNTQVIFYKYVKQPNTTAHKYELQIFMLAPWDTIHFRKMLYEIPYIYINKQNKFFLPKAKINMLELPKFVFKEDVEPLQINRSTGEYPSHLCYYCFNPYLLKLENLPLGQETPNYIKDRVPRIFLERKSNADMSYDLAPLPSNIQDLNNHFTYGPQIYYKFSGELMDRKKTLHLFTYTHWNQVRQKNIGVPHVKILLPNDDKPINTDNYIALRDGHENPKMPFLPFYGFVHPDSMFYVNKINIHHFEIKKSKLLTSTDDSFTSLTTKNPYVVKNPIKIITATFSPTTSTKKKSTTRKKKRTTKKKKTTKGNIQPSQNQVAKSGTGGSGYVGPITGSSNVLTNNMVDYDIGSDSGGCPICPKKPMQPGRRLKRWRRCRRRRRRCRKNKGLVKPTRVRNGRNQRRNRRQGRKGARG